MLYISFNLVFLSHIYLYVYITCVFCVISFSSKQNETTDERLKVSKQKAKVKSNSSSSEESSDSSSEDEPGLCVYVFLGFTIQLCSESEWGSWFVLTLMLYSNKQMTQNCTFLLPNTRPTHTMNV